MTELTLAESRADRCDELLDDALDDTFPASDPLAITAPGRPCPSGRPGHPHQFDPKERDNDQGI